MMMEGIIWTIVFVILSAFWTAVFTDFVMTKNRVKKLESSVEKLQIENAYTTSLLEYFLKQKR